MTAVYFNHPGSDDQRRQQLYDGDLFVYAPTEGTRQLCEIGRELCEDLFAPYHPVEAQHHLPVEEYNEILKELKPKFIHHPRCKEIIPKLLAEFGCDLDRTYFDVPRLRTATADEYLTSGLAYAFKPHRDTWYSPPVCQLNWWLPVYEIEANNGMAFYPEYWNKPVKNSSNTWHYRLWNETGRKLATQQSTKDTRIQSAALEKLNLDDDLRLVPEESGLLLFSAAHLHGTVPNTTNRTRISIDFRTVHLAELETDSGAPNLDSQCAGTTIMDYLRGSDLSNVPDAVQAYFEESSRPRLDIHGETMTSDVAALESAITSAH